MNAMESPSRKLVFTTAPMLVLMAVAILAFLGPGEEGARQLIRWTARTSLVFFALAFVAPALPRLPWLRVQRGSLLVCLAVSHGLHLIGIGLLASATGGANLAERRGVLRLGGGVVAYLVIGAAALWPDHPWVERGLWWVLIVFAAGYVPRAIEAPVVYGAAVAILAGIVAVRVRAWSSPGAAAQA
jgi:sulfoxide reductase heme-binding subunit YedZ